MAIGLSDIFEIVEKHVGETRCQIKVWGQSGYARVCAAKFYDMCKSPIECPKCELTFEPEVPKRPTREATPAAAAPEAKKVSDEILAKAKESDGDNGGDTDVDMAAGLDIDVDDDDDDDEQDKGVLEDASDLMGGDDDVPAIPETAKDGSPEDR